MRLISITNVLPGMVLAKPILSESGVVLVGKDAELTSRMIKTLQMMGIEHLYIRTPYTDDIEIHDIISPETRRRAYQQIKEAFREFETYNSKKYIFSSGKMERSFRPVLENIISELVEQKKVLDLVSTLYISDQEVYTHSFNVTVYATALAIREGLNQKQLLEFGIGAILHDIGKVGIPPEILNKPGKLTTEEFEQIKKHAEYGFELLRKQEHIPLIAAHMAFQHHERIDGTGYPRGLSGPEIHPFAKILAVSDVYDALTCHRVYRRAMLPHDALEILYAGSGTQFEQSYVESFRNTVAAYPIGLTVTLSTGEIGVVVDYNQSLPSRPIVRVIKDAEQADITPYEIDLSKKLNITITNCEAILF